MKTMQKDQEIRRVYDNRSEELEEEGWKFIPKSMWKQKVRPPKKAEVKEEKPAKEKSKYKAKRGI